ncbi:MAG TPA: pyrroline-5-carboxylate reductase [Burkholderiales bacterium]|nr:pyrroline-5-carboxylate reductase [Burkholderiales bacterium]
MKLCVIGGGNMAQALIGGLIDTGWSPADISVTTRTEKSRLDVLRNFRVKTFSDLAEISHCDIVLLAVKPQQLFDVALTATPYLTSQLVISIAAGICTDELRKWLNGHSRLIRAIPNTPARIRAGVTGLFAIPETNDEDRNHAERIFSSIGRIVWLTQESDMNILTAISGSGPAYVFYFMEAVIEAGISEGLSRETATELTLATFDGASRLAMASHEDIAELRIKVTSKGGTTEKALAVLINAKIKETIHEAVTQAAQRSKELGNELALMQKRN